MTRGLIFLLWVCPLAMFGGVGAETIQIQSLTVDSAGTVWAGTFGKGLLRSADAGASFADVPLPDAASKRVLAVATDGSKVVIGTESTGVWVRGADAGSFEAVVGIPRAASSEAVYRDPDGTWWVGTWDDGLFKSDSGKDFEAVPGFSSGGSAAVILAVSRSLFVGTTGDGVHVSRDHGGSWAKLAGVPGDANVASLAEPKAGSLLVGTSEGWLFRSDDLRSFRPLPNSIPRGATLYQVETGWDRWVVSSSQGFFESGNQGESWQGITERGDRYSGMVLLRDGWGGVIVVGQPRQPSKR